MRYTDAYLEYVKSVSFRFSSQPYVAIEKKVNLSAYVPGGFGTADCILISGSVLHVIDFKYGQGVPVDAVQNPQLLLYALGAYEAYKFIFPVQQIRLSIVQPRITEEPSEWECALDELLTFGGTVSQKAALAEQGAGDYAPGTETCRFCRARASCRARSDYNVKQAFSIGPLPPLISAEEAGKRLHALEDIAKYQKDLQEWALAECLAGREVPGWKAVEGRKNRDWTDMDKAFQTLQEKGIARALLYEMRPLTLAQVEKVIGKKDFKELVGGMVQIMPGKPTLVKESDKREAITNKVTAAKAFEEEKK